MNGSLVISAELLDCGEQDGGRSSAFLVLQKFRRF